MAGLVAVVVFAGVGAYTLLRDSGPSYPDEWDPRVLDLVAFVEEERGLEFAHPVHIDFLTPEEYSSAARTDAADLTDEERESFEEYAAVFRSLGLLSGEVDIFESVNDLSDGGTLAYYDHVTDRVTVRGTEVTVDLRVTLVHELVHVLQDQHFDLSRLASMETSGEAVAFRAIVEGDASLVESRYVETLSPDERGEYDATYLEQLEAANYDEIPGILTASFGAPYALGEPLVGIVQLAEGWAGVDAMLEDPPTTELELFAPLAHLNGFSPVAVDPIEVPDDHELIEEGDFGAITLYLMLAARTDPVAALAVVDEWTGDAYAMFRDPDGTVCTQLVLAVGDLDLVEDGLARWVDASPEGSPADLTRVGDRLHLRSCDPGADVEVSLATDPLDAIAVPASRSFLVYGTVLAGLEPDTGLCVADTVLAAVSLELLSDPDPAPEDVEKLQSTMFQAMQSCVVSAA